MENVKTGKEKQLVYAREYKRLSKAIKEEYYLEAIVIGYAIVEDRLVSFLHHAGIVSRNRDDLRINRCVYPYIRRLLGKKDDSTVKVKDITVKINLICKLLSLSAERAVEIDDEVENLFLANGKKSITRKGYMTDLHLQVNNTIDWELIADIFYELDSWRKERNQLIHALLNKTILSSEDAEKRCAIKGNEITRNIDNCLVKPFKVNNRIRKKYNIQ